MEISGIGQSPDIDSSAGAVSDVKKLLELQGQMILKLIESAQVPGPQDQATVSGLGTRIDLHI